MDNSHTHWVVQIVHSFIYSFTLALALARSSVHSIVFFRGVLGGKFAQVEVHKALELTASEQGHAAEVLDGLHHDDVLFR